MSNVKDIVFRKAQFTDALRLSILFQQVYIHTYGTEGVTTEYANFISKQFSVKRIESTIQQDPDTMLVATYHDNLIGVAEIAYNKKCPLNDMIAPELSKLYVLERFCAKGVGSGLLTEVEKLLMAKGHDELWLWVYVPNQRATSFYEKHRYEWIGNAFFKMEQNTYENKVMRKRLG